MRILIGGPVADCDKSNTPLMDETIWQFDVPNDVELTISWACDPQNNIGATRLERIVAGREKIRQDAITYGYDAIVFLDVDMTYDRGLLSKLVQQHRNGSDVVYNVYRLKNGVYTYNGFGGTLISQKVFSSIPFRCYINPQTRNEVDEGILFEMDVLNAGFKISRGIFGTTEHQGHITECRAFTVCERIRYSHVVRGVMAIVARNPSHAERLSRAGYWLMGEI